MPLTPWSERWSPLARAAGLAPTEAVLVALSGGADSVFLLHLVARAAERPTLVAVHVDHGLRGEESRADAAFCSRLCSRLGVPFVARTLDLGGLVSNVEARAREARYAVLFEEAQRAGLRTIVTGHHADDALETVLMRWMRGSAGAGLRGPRPTLWISAPPPPSAAVASGALPTVEPGDARPALATRRTLRVVRPLIGLRREEVRHLLHEEGLAWREDSSNADERFARNRVRRLLLPQLERLGGPQSLDNLRAFGHAVEELEDQLARRTAHLTWQTPEHARATRPDAQARSGGSLPRPPLMQLAAALRRRALWRLILEGTGRAPRRALLDALVGDLERGRCRIHALPGGYTLHLRSAELLCVPPATRVSALNEPQQLELLFSPEGCRPPQPACPAGRHPGRDAGPWRLPLPGRVRLSDGRALCARLVRREASAPPPTAPCTVELDARSAEATLSVRFPLPGDRVHPLGAPGSRALTRFLADAGIPREERARVPLVLSGDDIVWVAGVRPAQRARLRGDSALRLRLDLENAAGRPTPEEQGTGAEASARVAGAPSGAPSGAPAGAQPGEPPRPRAAGGRADALRERAPTPGPCDPSSRQGRLWDDETSTGEPAGALTGGAYEDALGAAERVRAGARADRLCPRSDGAAGGDLGTPVG